MLPQKNNFYFCQSLLDMLPNYVHGLSNFKETFSLNFLHQMLQGMQCAVDEAMTMAISDQ